MCVQALASSADAYAHHARQQRMGRGPVSSTDALPARLAAQQLGSLAGMSRKVQTAILHSQRVFEHQARQVECAIMQRCFIGWKGLRDRRALRAERAAHMRKQVERGLLLRCLRGWQQQAGSHERKALLLDRGRRLMGRGLLQRCFKEWGRLCGERWYKTQLELRDQQIQLLAASLRHLQTRPVRYMHRYRLRRRLAAWREATARSQAKRQVLQGAEAHARWQGLALAFWAWHAEAGCRAQRRVGLQWAQRQVARRRVLHAFAAWRSMVGAQQLKELAHQAADAARTRRLLLRALGGWLCLTQAAVTGEVVAARHQHMVMAAVLQGWRHQAAVHCAAEAAVQACRQQAARRLLQRALLAWQGYTDGKGQRLQEERACQLEGKVERLEAEMTHVKQDNERLQRVIDSGDWGRERVGELQQAGEVLQRERDALLRLVECLQTERPAAVPVERLAVPAVPPALHDATNSEAVGRRRVSLAAQLSVREATEPKVPPRAASPSRDAAARNKLLVQTGSSFNAMVGL